MTPTLLKHEWLRTRSMLTTIGGVALLLVVLGSLVAATRLALFSTIGSYAVILTIVALIPAVQVSLAVDYWRSSYARVGYFTQALPVAGPTIFRAKLLWALIATVAAVVWGVVLAAIGWPGTARGMGADELNPFAAFADLWSGATETIPSWQLVTGLLVALVLGVFIWPVQYYFSASIGSEEPRNRLGAGGPVLIWVALYVITQIVTLALLLAIPLGLGTATDGGLQIVSYAPLSELTADNPENIVPLGVFPGLVLVSAYCLWRTTRSWRSKVSLV